MDQMNIKLTLSFDGSSFSGWQKQKNSPSVQGKIEQALSAVYKCKIVLAGIGRTDAGAHANQFTANFIVKKTGFPIEKLCPILNRRLYPDIWIGNAEEVPLSFHSRFSASAREYIYQIILLPRLTKRKQPLLPFISRYAGLSEREIDISRLRAACRLFAGIHSFRNFCYGYKKDMNFIRKVYYFRAADCGEKIIFFIKGSGFLKGMIRSLISVCLNYESGKLSLKTIKQALENKIDLPVEFKVPVPACGLYFKRGYFNSPSAS